MKDLKRKQSQQNKKENPKRTLRTRICRKKPEVKSGRGRPRIENRHQSPKDVQMQFSQGFIDLAKLYCDHGLQNNYIWSESFSLGKFDGEVDLSLSNQKHRGLLCNVIYNSHNIMEKECAHEFQKVCTSAYRLYQNHLGLEQCQKQIIKDVQSPQSQFQFLNLRSSQIPDSHKTAQPQSIRVFIKGICCLVHSIFQQTD